MRLREVAVAAIGLAVISLSGVGRSAEGQPQKITDNQRSQAEAMLADIRDVLKKNYYDPTYHGIDIDARYRTYKEKVIKSETLGDAFRTIAAYLSGLDDSHTFFVPPRRSYQTEYGYMMQMIGDACYITQVRPETDAAQKLHPGDQVLSLDGYSVNRKDIWQLQYFLNQLAPKPASEFTLRAPSGAIRKEQVLTKYTERKHLKDLTFEHGDNDTFNLIFEGDKQRHLLRHRYVELGDVMIWKMPIFQSSEGEVDRMVNLARKHKTLILDLRDNPGGYDFTLERMIGNFFDHDVKIGMRVTRKGEKQEIAKPRGKNVFTGNVIVLVNSGSASASEVFARVVQLEHHAKVIGDRTSGSVMESLYYPFSAGADIQVFYGAAITIADLVMADGNRLEKVGVTPDEFVLTTGAQLAEGQDPVLARAAELAGIKLDPIAAGKLFPFEWKPL